MKTWNVPAIKELDVMMTASGSVPADSEKVGYGLGDGVWVKATHNSTTHEYHFNPATNTGCISPKETVES